MCWFLLSGMCVVNNCCVCHVTVVLQITVMFVSDLYSSIINYYYGKILQING